MDEQLNNAAHSGVAATRRADVCLPISPPSNRADRHDLMRNQ